MEACIPCTNVPTSHEFKSVLSLASGEPSPNSPYIYLSWAQAERRLREAKNDVRRMRRQNATLAKTIDRLEHKEQSTEDMPSSGGESEMLIDPPPDEGEKMN